MTEEPPDFDQVFRDRVDAPNPVLHTIRVYGTRYRRVLIAALVTATVLPLLNLVPAFLLGVAIDIVATEEPLDALPLVPDASLPPAPQGQLVFLFALLTGTALVSLVLRSVDSLLWSWLEHHVEHDVRTDAYDAAQALGMEFFASAQTGDVLNVLSADMDTFEDVLGEWFKRLFQVVVFGVGMAVVMLAMNWQLAVVVLSVGVPLAVATYLFHTRAAKRYTAVRRDGGQIHAHLEACIGGISAIKANTSEEYERRRLRNRSRDFRDTRVSVHTFVAVYAGTRRLLLEGSTLLVLSIGGWAVLPGTQTGYFGSVTVGTFVTFFFYARRFTDRMNDLGKTVNGYDQIAAAGRRVYGLVNYPVRIDGPSDPEPLECLDGSVVYDDVTFRYPGADEVAVDGVSFEVRPGEFVGIVGPTGAGKSSLVKLLIRLYDPDEGSISVNGHDLRGVALADLRGSIGYIHQEPFLFDDTVRGNIAYANREASEEAVVEAAKRARAHEFVTDLPEGYDTEVGERGVKLSGGQRQRLVIARELLRDPDLLVLDEATSHVDSETERLVQRSFNRLTADRTTLAIAHQLSTVRDADRILVMDNGAIRESGTHEELVAKDGLYATLWNVHTARTDDLPAELLP